MKFYTDHYFHIGYGHLNSGKPCQDYSLSGVYNDMAYAIVSDGCSTGGNTDVGSRIISFSTKSILKDYWLLNKDIDFNISEINLRQKIAISNSRINLDLKTNDLYATCNYIYLSKNRGFIHTQGDGVIAIKYLDGNIEMYRLDWQNNMPYYPAYAEMELENFIIAHGNDLNKKVLKKEGNYDKEIEELTLKDGINGSVIPIFNIENIEFIAVFSDGITQIENCDWKDEVCNFMAFKSLSGEFLKRRMINAIKTSKQKGNGPLDDISCAVIRIDHKDGEINDN
jgi:hypothetical protein